MVPLCVGESAAQKVNAKSSCTYAPHDCPCLYPDKKLNVIEDTSESSARENICAIEFMLPPLAHLCPLWGRVGAADILIWIFFWWDERVTASRFD